MTIDLSLIPAPAVIESLDYETLLAQRKAALLALWPEADRPALAATLALETEPLTKFLQESAYRELLLRARINDAAHACMLPYATGPDLDNLGALYSVTRLTLIPADTVAVPPTPAVMETDTDLRRRIQLAPEGLTVAGSRGAYKFHALSAAADVKDATVDSPIPGTVRVTVLSRIGDGTASPTLQAAVLAALNADTVRPLCDTVEVQSADIVDFSVAAVLNVLPGPSPEAVRQAALAALGTALADLSQLGRDITRSALFAALHQPGTQRVDLTHPAADIPLTDAQAGHCTGITVTLGVIEA